MAITDDWLALVREEPLEPELAICDPHHHLWDRRDGRVDRRYLLDEILADIGTDPGDPGDPGGVAGGSMAGGSTTGGSTTGGSTTGGSTTGGSTTANPASGMAGRRGHRIVSTVFVEHLSMFRASGPPQNRYVGEVEFANGIGAMAASGLYGPTRVAAGIVGYADLAAGKAARPVLEALVAAAPDRMRGIRCSGAWDPDPRIGRATRSGLYLDAGYRQGAREVAALGLVLDVPIRFPQLPECLDMARALPGLTIVLNHLGGIAGIGAYAGRQDEVLGIWRKSMADLAACPNVVVKIGGLGMEYCGFGWHERARPPTSQEMADAIRPYVETAIGLFGPQRCMFESNFPVDKVSSSYAVVWNAFKRITAGCPADEKALLYHDTASRIYRLAEAP